MEVDREQGHNKTLADARRASIYGSVNDGDKLGIPVKGATVYLEATSIRNRTDAHGKFALEQLVAPADYVLIIEATGFPTVREPIDLIPGVVAYRNFTMHRGASVSSGTSAHQHGLGAWPESGKKTLLETTVTLSRQGGGLLSVQNQYVSGVPAAEIQPALDQIVLPGTTRVDVELDWEAAANDAPRTAGIVITTPRASYSYPDRQPGEPFRLFFFPDEADRGHQHQSLWKFKAFAGGSAKSWAAWARAPSAEIDIRVTIHRGSVPYEPPHPDEWGNATARLVWKTTEQGAPGPAIGDGGLATGRTEAYVVVRTADVIHRVCCGPNPAVGRVPPGSKYVEGFFGWKNPDGVGDSENPSWVLYYKSPIDTDWRAVTDRTEVSATNFTFKVPVAKNEVDPFYQKGNWQFGAGIEAFQENPAGVSAYRQMFLNKQLTIKYNFTVTKDPDYVLT